MFKPALKVGRLAAAIQEIAPKALQMPAFPPARVPNLKIARRLCSSGRLHLGDSYFFQVVKGF